MENKDIYCIASHVLFMCGNKKNQVVLNCYKLQFHEPQAKQSVQTNVNDLRTNDKHVFAFSHHRPITISWTVGSLTPLTANNIIKNRYV